MIEIPSSAELHGHVQRWLADQRDRIPARLAAEYDALLDRHGFRSDDPTTLTGPLNQPIVMLPVWVAAAATADPGPAIDGDDLVDLVESTVAGYLYVRTQDDLVDEGAGTMPEAMFLADSFLVRHVRLLASMPLGARFWEFHETTALEYADAMLLEREVSNRDVAYPEELFDAVLRRSRPLVLPGAALCDLADRWGEVPLLARFVHHTVRAGQIVDDILDCERDVAAGNYTWVARRLGALDDPEGMARRLVLGELDELVAVIEADLDAAAASAATFGLPAAVDWVEARRRDVVRLKERILTAALFG